jgi:nucleoside-diphosphate-sugar epimerase
MNSSPPRAERWFVTGAAGCIGAWVLREILAQGHEPVAFDLRRDERRLRQVLDHESDLERVAWLEGDVTDGAAVRGALERSGARHVVHLAGLQVPFCAADPVKGAQVNVVGTLNVFEAARALQIPRLAYASSAAVYGRDPDEHDQGGADETQAPTPRTHYGVYKLANEGSARVYFDAHGISSAGLRPLTVYGVARDQGLTSGPTKAIKAAVAGLPYVIRFTGTTDFLFAEDAARAFVAGAAQGPAGARVFNVHGEAATIARFLELLAQRAPSAGAKIRAEGGPLAIAGRLESGALDGALPGLRRTSLADGIARTAQSFTRLMAAGRLPLEDLDG